MVKGGLALFVAEQRAVYLAEIEIDRAEAELIASVQIRSSLRSPKRQAARWRYQRALVELQSSLARLNAAKCRVAGRRHLALVGADKTQLSTSNCAASTDTVPVVT